MRLPPHITLSPPYDYDLGRRQSLLRCYARVMTEGFDDEVRWFIDLDVLVEVWDELYLSPHVHEAWG